MDTLHETKTRCWIACEQALRDVLEVWREKEGDLAATSLDLNICIEKIDAKCWLAEMTLVMTSLPLARTCFHVFFTCSCKLSFLFPPRSQNAPESLLAGYLLDGTGRSGARKTKRLHRLKAKLISFLFKVALCCLPFSKVFFYHETFSGKGYTLELQSWKRKKLGHAKSILLQIEENVSYFKIHSVALQICWFPIT